MSDQSVVQALLSEFSQRTRLLRLFTPLGPDVLLAECVRGEEALGAGFTFTVSALSTNAAIPLKALLGQSALLELLTAQGRDCMRPFHGHIIAAESCGANGGLARYTLTIAPWTSFLKLGRDSRVFQQMTAMDILAAVFAGYEGKGRLSPRWRFDLADPSVYPIRSLTTQYQESNLAFVERLMMEEGLFYFFEHEGDREGAAFGSHTMVIADHNGSFAPNVQPQVRFTQSSAVMKEDGIDRWRTALYQRSNAVALGSWDYRSLDTRPAEASDAASGDAELMVRDHPGAYAYPSRQQGRRRAENLVQGLAAVREVQSAAGTVRNMAPGTTFTLHGQARLDAADNDDARTFVVVRAVHLMHNNLSAELRADIEARLKPAALSALIGADATSSLHAVGTGKGERPLYRNRIDVLPASRPYRSYALDEQGAVRFPRPAVGGQQTAIVVGPPGSAIHTDRDHRVKVQFHWQRGAQSHSRLQHPDGDTHTGAPADDTAGTWVRVASTLAPVAGANWGGNAVPRVGQEVLVDFVEGDIDRPIIIGAVFNGRGEVDKQQNQLGEGTGACTGNAPAWFAGESGANAHPAVLSGMKSQAMKASQGGAGSYSQLVLDDSAGQSRLSLQRHAAAHKGTDELNLGSLRHQADNLRLDPCGFGAELKTESAAALRAGRGMLLSTHARHNASGQQLDSREAGVQIQASLDLVTSLARTAHQHNARMQDDPGADKLPAIERMADSITVLDGVAAGDGAPGADAGRGEASAYTMAQLQLSGAAGIVATTPASAVISASRTTAIAAGQDINLASQGNQSTVVKDGISLFTYGKALVAGKPNQETGISLHAASGKVVAHSQSNAMRITADKAITVASVTKSVRIAARQNVMLTAQSAFLKLEGGDIMLHGPGKIEFKATMKELAGPVDGTFGAPELPEAKPLYDEQFLVKDEITGAPLANIAYRIVTGEGKEFTGITDQDGQTQRIHGARADDIKFFFD